MSDQETTNETEQPSDQLEEEKGTGDEETEPETHDGQEVEPSEESEDASEGKQEGAATTTPVAATAGAGANAQTVTWKEDANDFDESTIEIGITLHPLKGRPPEERLVTFCIHNHSGPPVTNYYTQGELTNESPLDRLLWATAQEIRKFRAELSRRKQEQFEREEQAKRSKRERKVASPVRVEPSAATHTAVTAPASPAERETAPTVQGEHETSAASAAAPVPTTPSSKPAKQGNELVQQPLF